MENLESLIDGLEIEIINARANKVNYIAANNREGWLRCSKDIKELRIKRDRLLNCIGPKGCYSCVYLFSEEDTEPCNSCDDNGSNHS